MDHEIVVMNYNTLRLRQILASCVIILTNIMWHYVKFCFFYMLEYNYNLNRNYYLT